MFDGAQNEAWERARDDGKKEEKKNKQTEKLPEFYNRFKHV